MLNTLRTQKKNLTKLGGFLQLASVNKSTEIAKEHGKNKEVCEASHETFSFVDRLRFERLARIHRKSYLKQEKLVFIHNPRTGGQSFATLAYGKSLGHLTASKIKATIGSDEYRNRISIGFVRDPVERLISAYNFSRQGGTSVVKQNRFKRVPRWALERFDIFCSEWLFKEKKENLDLIFRSQYLWFLDKDKELIVDHMLDISKLAEFTIACFGDNVMVPKINQSYKSISTRQSIPIKLIQDIYTYYQNDIKLLALCYNSTYRY